MATTKKTKARKKPVAKKRPTKKAKATSRKGVASELAWPIRLRGKLLLEMKLALAELEKAQSDKSRIGLQLSLESAKAVHMPLLKIQAEAAEAGRQVASLGLALGEVQKRVGAKHGLKPEELSSLSFDPDSGAVFWQRSKG